MLQTATRMMMMTWPTSCSEALREEPLFCRLIHNNWNTFWTHNCVKMGANIPLTDLQKGYLINVDSLTLFWNVLETDSWGWYGISGDTIGFRGQQPLEETRQLVCICFLKKNIWLCSGVICKYIYTQFWKALKLTKTMHAYLRCGGQNSIEICSVWKVREGLPQLPELAPRCFKNREEVASQDKYCTFVDPTLQEECSTIFGGLPRPPIPWLGSLYLWLWWSLLLGWEVFGRANQI